MSEFLRSFRRKSFRRPRFLRPFLVLSSISVSQISSVCLESLILCEKTNLYVDDCHKDCDGLIPDTDAKKCIKRSVFSESHLPHDIAAVVIWFLGAGLSMSAGVGGGGIYVPLGLILLRFGAKAATGLSQASIFGASLGGLYLNLQNRHPLANRPVIDLDMALFLAPMEMAGAVVGVIVQKLLPDWCVILIMAVVLGYTSVKTFNKGRQVYAKETNAMKKREEENQAKSETSEKKEVEKDDTEQKDDTPEERVVSAVEIEIEEIGNGEKTGVENGNGEEKTEQEGGVVEGDGEGAAADDAKNSNRQIVDGHVVKGHRYTKEEWLAKDAGSNVKGYTYLAFLWIFLILIFIFRGGKGMESAFKDAIPFCGVGYWLFGLLAFVWLFGFGAVMGRRAVSKSIRKQQVDFPVVEGDVLWDYEKVFFYAKWTFVAGNIAGLIGIGGGMVLGPLMLQMGILPQVSTATTATMVVLTSSSVAVLYVVGGLVPWSYAVLFFSVAFVGAIVGKIKIDAAVKARGLTSILIFILAGIIFFASVMVTIAGFMKYSERCWEFEGFQELCGK